MHESTAPAAARPARLAEPFRVLVGKRLVELNLKTRDLAERSGIPASTLRGVLAGRPPSWETAEAVLAALDLEIRPAAGER